MKCDRKMLRLYAVTDRAWTAHKSLLAQVEDALRGGASCIQLREKDLPDDAFLDEARKMKALCHRYKVPFIINDNVDVAIRCQADGIHVGQQDMQATDVRARIGADMLLGVSVQTVAQAVLAQNNGADYLGVGAMFPTPTKQDADAVSREELIQICKAVHIPVVAIGGISRENLLSLAGTGIEGVALVSAIFACEDIETACQELKVLSEEMVRR